MYCPRPHFAFPSTQSFPVRLSMSDDITPLTGSSLIIKYLFSILFELTLTGLLITISFSVKVLYPDGGTFLAYINLCCWPTSTHSDLVQWRGLSTTNLSLMRLRLCARSPGFPAS